MSVTRTNASGFYEFVRADGVVKSNRNWFVLGPDNSHSRTIHEWVSANVVLNASAPSATTAQDVTFSGTVFPSHTHQRVLLQEQNSTSGNGWQTIASGYTNDASAFSITHRFRSAGSYTLRAFFPADPRNIASQSAKYQPDRPAAAEPVVHDQRLRAGHHRRPVRIDHRHAVRSRLDHDSRAQRSRDAVRQAADRFLPGAREHHNQLRW